MNILLLGYYGHKNIGDDLFVENLVKSLAKKDREISFLCDEDYYKKDYLDNSNINFFNSKTISKTTRLKLLLGNDFIAWGGGTLNLSSKPRNLAIVQTISRIFRKKFGFLGIGLDGLSPNNLDSVGSLFNQANYLYLRDDESYHFALEKFNVVENICVGGDLAFLNLELYTDFVKSSKTENIKNISFSGKHWWGQGRAEFYAEPLLSLIEKYDSQIHLLPANIDEKTNDNKFHEKLKSCLPKDSCVIHSWEQVNDFLRVLGNMDFHIGNRLHSIILADILGIPNIGISSNPPKIKNYIQKTAALTQERTSEFMEHISLEQIEFVLENYQRPDRFIAHESQSAQDCLIQIFGP